VEWDGVEWSGVVLHIKWSLLTVRETALTCAAAAVLGTSGGVSG
jgi:hypothetical protein